MFERQDQETVDNAVAAVAWSIYESARARELASIAVRDTGLGNVPDKIAKNQRKALGCLRDLAGIKTVGIADQDLDRGLTRYYKPVGLVAAICPSTNPAATAACKTMMAIKGRNAIVLAPSPSGCSTILRLTQFIRTQFARIGLPPDLVQCLPPPITKERTDELTKRADLVVATGSEDTVQRANQSGIPAFGTGRGNVAVIIDASANLDEAIFKIVQSKTFDNSTSCSSENALVIVDPLYDRSVRGLIESGGYLPTPEERVRIQHSLWRHGRLNRDLLGKDVATIVEVATLNANARAARFILVEEEGIGPEYPFSGEKLALILTLYRATTFSHAKEIVTRLLKFQGIGHSAGIFTRERENAMALAAQLPVGRVLVNQAHALNNGGSVANGLNFSLSIGCGTWARNMSTENLSWRNFVNVTQLVEPIPAVELHHEALFSSFFARYGR